MLKSKRSKLLFRLCLSSMFLALALITKLFVSISIPIFGGNGMKVGFGGVFTAFPAIMFGPLYGGVVSGLSDFLGYVLKPDGAYIPYLTITAFFGGVLKGLVWMLLVRIKEKIPLRSIIAVILAAIGLLGVANHIMINSDGVGGGFIAYADELPYRSEIEKVELSALSALSVELAKYNNDVVTLKSAEDTEEITLPAYADIGGGQVKITKAAESALENCPSLKTLIIPSTYKTLPEKMLNGTAVVKIIGVSGTAAQTLAEKNGIEFEASQPEESTFPLGGEEFTLSSNDAFRRYLSAYINMLTVGLEAIAVAGGIVIAVDFAVSRKKQKNGKTQKHDFLRIFITIFTSGVVVTTLNTFILRLFLSAWAGRAFYILWIPRLIEEMLICLIQAYLISVLYELLMSGKYIRNFSSFAEK